MIPQAGETPRGGLATHRQLRRLSAAIEHTSGVCRLMSRMRPAPTKALEVPPRFIRYTGYATHLGFGSICYTWWKMTGGEGRRSCLCREGIPSVFIPIFCQLHYIELSLSKARYFSSSAILYCHDLWKMMPHLATLSIWALARAAHLAPLAPCSVWRRVSSLRSWVYGSCLCGLVPRECGGNTCEYIVKSRDGKYCRFFLPTLEVIDSLYLDIGSMFGPCP